MDKIELRKQMIKKRLDLSSEDHAAKSNLIISKLKQHPDFINAKTIGIDVYKRQTIDWIKIKIHKKIIVEDCIPRDVIKPRQFAIIGPTYGIIELTPETTPKINQLGCPISTYIIIVVIAWAIAPIKNALTYWTNDKSISFK